jgi:SAM-dependent methyltransferase
MDDRRAHWERVYERPRADFSWFEADPAVSFAWVMRALGDRRGHVIDIGGGDSPLASRLVDAGVAHVTVLDVSQTALDRGRRLSGDRGGRIQFLRADVTGEWSAEPVDAWHDRAAFHFLIADEDRARYARRAADLVQPGGGLVIATFADDGPERCSGLPVRRHSEADLARAFPGFSLVESSRLEHRTPAGAVQRFVIARLVHGG